MGIIQFTNIPVYPPGMVTGKLKYRYDVLAIHGTTATALQATALQATARATGYSIKMLPLGNTFRL